MTLDLRFELPDWHLQAACRGANPDLFFPEHGASTRKAKAICAGCPVRTDCADWAIENNPRFGVWGGQTERVRRDVTRTLQETGDVKRCSHCLRVKQRTEFPANASNPDGLHSWCKQCRQNYANAKRGATGWRGPTARLPKGTL